MPGVVLLSHKRTVKRQKRDLSFGRDTRPQNDVEESKKRRFR